MELDEEKVDAEIKSKLQEAYRELLDHHNIESGDIAPAEKERLDNAEDKVVEATENWLGNTLDMKAEMEEEE